MALSNETATAFPIQTLTLGSTQAVTSSITNDFRFNYSRSDTSLVETATTFGGAVPPPSSLLFPSPFTAANAGFTIDIIGSGTFNEGDSTGNSQRQFDVVDGLTKSFGAHQLKFGGDYRRLTPKLGGQQYAQSIFFLGLTGPDGVDSGSIPLLGVLAEEPFGMVFNNLSLYAQDTWRLSSRVTLTYGLRWELNPPLHGTNGQVIYTVENLNDPTNIALAPPGTHFYKTTYDDFAPRVGVAIQISTRKGFERVVRGGFGVFYDLGVGTLAAGSAYFPYSVQNTFSGVPYPIPSSIAAPPPFTTTIPSGGISQIVAAVPNLQLPRTLQWNLALEQAIGSNQSLSVTYVGSNGQDLLRRQDYINPNPNFNNVYVTTNSATSDYNALQIQYQRRLSGNLQAMGFYSWSHCIDDASNDSSNLSDDPRIDRGNCDFDIRHSFHGVLTYNIPTPHIGNIGRAILGGWAVDTTAAIQSAPPVDLNTGATVSTITEQISVRPDVIPGIPPYLYGAACTAANGGMRCPGGKAVNFTPGAVAGGCPDGSPSVGPFCSPPTGQQGNLPRNALRGFGLTQVDFALRRSFKLAERWNLQFSGEAFNVLNHPNFGTVDTCTCDSPGTFGQATTMLNNGLSQGGAGFSPLYQVGGPRSIQLALKLFF